MRESEKKYRTVADNTYDWSFWLDPNGDFIYTSPSCERITGYRPEEFKKDPDLLSKILHPDDKEAFKKHVYEHEKKAGPGDLELRLVTKTGIIIWIHHMCQPVFDEQKHFLGSIGSNRDITTRKSAELALQEAKRLAEMYVELMGHDINNKNQVGIGYLELVLNEPGLSEDVKRSIEKALGALHDSSGIINNVEKLQRISSGKVKVEKIDLGQKLVDIRARYLESPGKAVTINYTPEKECFVWANELLTDIFSNIIENAIKHSRGPVTIDIKRGEMIRDGKYYCKVTIDDNGPGIPDELKERLFARFQRGVTRAKGKGLGLYLVKSLVESYGGMVWVEDRVRGDHTGGARFVVALPAVEK
ncbi:putative histidine kinase [Methanocella paludicola SANAE]|uniref:histidine kinase n=1 Tax=Methanocella paludicola (strain DSM 17711 / JCM 13418 / NBRC 101707 / SANAE) TaxID=304371 RepID=D1YVF7_METPS|nr:putative histidine kinase [Methanocella paludicola SANAE]